MFVLVPAGLEEVKQDTKLLFLFERQGRSVVIPCQCKAEKDARFAIMRMVIFLSPFPALLIFKEQIMTIYQS